MKKNLKINIIDSKFKSWDYTFNHRIVFRQINTEIIMFIS